MEDWKHLIEFFAVVTVLYQKLGSEDVHMNSLMHERGAVEMNVRNCRVSQLISGKIK